MSREEKAAQPDFIFSKRNEKKEPMQGRAMTPFLSSAGGSTSVVALSVHEEMLPLEDERRMSG